MKNETHSGLRASGFGLRASGLTEHGGSQKFRLFDWRAALRGAAAAVLALGMAGGAVAQTVSYPYLSSTVDPFIPPQHRAQALVTVDNSGGAAIAAGVAQYTITGLPASANDAACSDSSSPGAPAMCSTSIPGISGGTLSLPLNAIAANAIVSFFVTYAHNAPNGTTYTETHSISGIPANSRANTVTVTAGAAQPAWNYYDFHPVDVTAPGTVTHTLTLVNWYGNSIPAGAIYRISGLPASGISPGTCNVAGCTVALNGSTLEVTLPAIAAGGQQSFQVSYLLDNTLSDATYTETHAVTGTGIGPNFPFDNTIQVNVKPVFTHTDTSSTPLTPPAQVSTTITINNTTGAPIAAGAQYTIGGLPAGASNANCTGTGCGSAGITGGTLSMTLGAIPPGNQTLTITYDIATSVTATYTENHALDASGIANLDSLSQSNTINITAAAVLASVTWSTPYTGTTTAPGTVTHTVTVNNTGGAAIPAGATYVISGLPASGISAGACSLVGCTLAPTTGSTLTATLPGINAGASVTFSVSYALDNTVPVGTNYTEQHSLSGTGITTGTLSNPISVMPFASGQGGAAVSVPLLGPLGLLALSLFTAGAPLAARRRRQGQR